MEALLKVNELTKAFSGLVVLSDLNFDVRNGEILGIIGPNGAGKTTLYNVITGFTKPNRGNILFKNTDITNLPTHKRVKMGIVRTFQNGGLFNTSTVKSNILTGCF